jgi:hypothetical protein
MASSIIPFYLMLLNRRHAKRREELGKTAVLVDESMMGKNQMEDSKTGELEEGARGKKALEEDRGLQDVTDLQNEDFIYVY